MKANFDGMRKTATSDMNKLCSTLQEIVESGTLFDDQLVELIENFNSAAQSVAFFNCLYDDDVEGDLSDLYDMEVDRLEEAE